MDVYGYLTIDGQAAGTGVEIAVFDPQGVLCGVSGVDSVNGGAFLLHIYGDDPFTGGIDEGASAQDSLLFKIYDPSLPGELEHRSITFVAASFGPVPATLPPLFQDFGSYGMNMLATSLLPHFPAPVGSLLSATFSGQAKFDSSKQGAVILPVAGSEVGVFARGLLCGRGFIEEDGSYTVVVYGDDPVTAAVEGAVAGEVLTFRIWDAQRQKELPARTLQPNGSRQPVTWSDNGGGTVDLHGLAQQHIGVFRKMADGSARWYTDADGNGQWGGLDFTLTGFGLATDKIAPGDWNGDGLLDPGVFRSVNGQGWWYFDTNGSGVWESGIDQALQFGLAGDIPVVGDWNGDGVSDFGVFRNKNGQGWWYFDSNGNRAWDPGVDQALQFGLGTDIPVVGDWNGDGISDFGVFRVINGQGWWFFDTDGNRRWDSSIDQRLQFGLAGDLPVAGDWNGDGRS
ncbi:MAG: VCBS repeat-containing protein, partial [Desulfuromonadales bacterium]|nr:VCBS repeat-containing protein [Desulfuromonadales bacterium]